MYVEELMDNMTEAVNFTLALAGIDPEREIEIKEPEEVGIVVSGSGVVIIAEDLRGEEQRFILKVERI